MPRIFEAPPGFVLNPDYLVPELLAQRDALLEALKEIHQATMRNGIVLAKCVGINAVAGMAIAKAEGEKNGQA